MLQQSGRPCRAIRSPDCQSRQDTLVKVTDRTVQARFLLIPSRELNEIGTGPVSICVRTLLDGEPLEGLWFDRTKEYSARNRGKTISPSQFATTETVTLSPLPCWEHLSPEQRCARVEAIVQRIEETAAKKCEESGSAVLGAAAVCAQKPFDQPARPKKSPAPLFHGVHPPRPP